MRGGALPPALLGVALGLRLAPAPARVRIPALLAYAAAMATAELSHAGAAWREPIFLGCWASLIATAACVHVSKDVGVSVELGLAVNAGVWSGAVIAVAGAPLDLLKVAPCAPAAMLAAGVISRRAPIAVKVAASWLMAVAALAAILPYLPVTPGYEPDHLD